KEPKTTLEVPQVDVMDAVIKLWHQEKKHANVVLVMDTSGSMNEQNKMGAAKIGALQLVSLLADDDLFGILPFSDRPAGQPFARELKNSRSVDTSKIESLFPAGGTALYDAVDLAYNYEVKNLQPDRISAVVVLTDGE